MMSQLATVETFMPPAPGPVIAMLRRKGLSWSMAGGIVPHALSSGWRQSVMAGTALLTVG